MKEKIASVFKNTLVEMSVDIGGKLVRDMFHNGILALITESWHNEKISLSMFKDGTVLYRFNAVQALCEEFW